VLLLTGTGGLELRQREAMGNGHAARDTGPAPRRINVTRRDDHADEGA
jgi:hypothetical protein